MRKLFIVLVLTLALCSFLTVQAVAAGQAQKTPAGAQTGAQAGQLQNADRLSQFMGKSVQDQQGQKIGTIEDVVVDKQGRVTYLILSGSDLGKRDQLIPVPWRAANPQIQKGAVTISLNRLKLQNAPGFAKNDWSQFNQMEQRVNSYYGQAGAQPGQMPGGQMEKGPTGQKSTAPGASKQQY
jgi:sporulation protein YlmC with PRC-barrel domain